MWLSDSKNKQQQKYFSQQEILHPAQAHKHMHANTRTNSWYIDWKMHTKNSSIGTLIVVLEMVCCVGLTRKATWNGNLVIFFVRLLSTKYIFDGIYFYYAFNIHRQSIAVFGIGILRRTFVAQIFQRIFHVNYSVNLLFDWSLSETGHKPMSSFCIKSMDLDLINRMFMVLMK